MRVSPGCVGLAAPQVGVGAQVFVVDVTGHPKAATVHGTFVLCNAGRRGEPVAARPRGVHVGAGPDRRRQRAGRVVVEAVCPAPASR